MKIVLDTNTLISGYFWNGKPRQILMKAANGDCELICSPALLDEFQDVLSRPKFAKLLEKIGRSQEDLLSEYENLAQKVIPSHLPDICRDPEDNHILVCAVEGGADYIITGDDDLLTLNPYESIPIVKANDFLDISSSDI